MLFIISKFPVKFLILLAKVSDVNGPVAITVTAPTIEGTDTSIDVFPNELEHVVVLGACARLKQRQISFFNDDEDSEVVALHRAQYAELDQKYKETLSPFIARKDWDA